MYPRSNVRPYAHHAHIGTARQMEILVAVHEEGSVTKAAELLHLSQPSVSMQLAKLSDALGLELYYQIGKKIHFSEAGLAVVESARDILRCYEYLGIKMAQFKGLTAGSLSLCVVTTAKYFIPHLIGAFSKAHPDINIQFKVANREKVIQRTHLDQDDFYVFSHPPKESDLELLEFLPNNLLPIVPLDHAMAKRKRIGLDAFLKQPFLMREEGSGTRHAIETFLAAKNKKANVRMTIESNEAIKHAVMSGLGVSILSEHTLSFGELNGLAVVNVDHLPIATKWYLVRKSARPLSPAAEQFLEYAKTQV